MNSFDRYFCKKCGSKLGNYIGIKSRSSHSDSEYICPNCYMPPLKEKKFSDISKHRSTYCENCGEKIFISNIGTDTHRCIGSGKIKSY